MLKIKGGCTMHTIATDHEASDIFKELFWSDYGTIRDVIYGSIPITREVRYLIDNSPIFQRLRYIRQLGFVHYVFPSANHTRFEHSLGVWYITRKILVNNLSRGIIHLSKKEFQCIEAAALLHDIGHLPFGHELEDLPEIRDTFSHTKIGKSLVTEKGDAYPIYKNRFNEIKLRKILTNEIWGFDDDNVDSIGKIINEEHPNNTLERIGNIIINGIICADRIDCLMRDAYYCNIDLKFVDIDRIIRSIKISNDKNDKEIIIDQKGLRALEMMIIGRYLMYTNVYWHHTVRALRSMIRKALQIAIETGDTYSKKKDYNLSIEDIITLTDDDLLRYLVEHYERGSPPHTLSHNILYRQNIYKRGAVRDIHRVDKGSELYKELIEELTWLIKQIAQKKYAKRDHEQCLDLLITTEDKIIEQLCDVNVHNTIITTLRNRIEFEDIPTKEIDKLRTAMDWYNKMQTEAKLNTEMWRKSAWIIADTPIPSIERVKHNLLKIDVYDTEAMKSYEKVPLLKMDSDDIVIGGISDAISGILNAFDKTWKFRIFAKNRELGTIVQTYFELYLDIDHE
jgi:HD superfamily phosphohydrolase